MTLPPLDCLRYFYAAARHESFLLAAKELHVTPPAISHRIKQLEENLGLSLFRRSPRGVALTAKGQTYFQKLRIPLQQIEMASDKLRGEPEYKRIRILCLGALADSWLIPLLVDFTKENPNITYDLKSGYAQSLADLRNFDVWITYGDEALNLADGHLLFKDEIVIVGSPDFHQGIKTGFSYDDLSSAKPLFDQHWRDDWNVWLNANSLPPLNTSLALGFKQHSHMLRACAQGAGIAATRLSAAAPLLKRNELVQLLPDTVRTAGAYFLGKSSEAHAEAECLVDWLIQLKK